MMLALAIVAVLATQCLAGLATTALVWPARDLSWPRRLSRALLLGPGALTLQMGLWHLLSVPFSLTTVLTPWWLLALLFRRTLFRRPTPTTSVGPGERGLVAAAAALSTVALWLALQTPVYTADGLNNFALPARVFATHAGLAPERLATLTLPGHLEYPPLVALNESLSMRAAAAAVPGDPGTLAVKVFFVLPVLAFALLAIELFSSRLRPALAVPAALVALGIPTLLSTPTAGMADLHLTAALLLLGLEGAALLGRPTPGRGAAPDRSPAWWPCIAAAVTVGLTKDEGVAVASLACLPLGWVVWRRGVGLTPGLVGLAAVLGLAWSWRLFVAWHGLPYDPALTWPAGGLPEALGRVPAVLARFAELPFGYAPGGVSPWGLLWPITGAAVALALVAAPRGGRRGLVGPAVVLAAHLGLYLGVYMFTSQPLDWVLGNSAPRVFMHLLPWLLLLLAAAAAPFGGRPQRPGA